MVSDLLQGSANSRSAGASKTGLPAEDHEGVHLAAAPSPAHERRDGLGVGGALRRLEVVDRLPDVAELSVDQGDEGVDPGGQPGPAVIRHVPAGFSSPRRRLRRSRAAGFAGSRSRLPPAGSPLGEEPPAVRLRARRHAGSDGPPARRSR